MRHAIQGGGKIATDASGNIPVSQATTISGETNIDSVENSYIKTNTPANVTLLHATTAVSIGLAAGDTYLLGLIIPAAATPITCIIAGFEDEDGTAATYTFTGKDSDVTATDPSGLVDTVITFGGLGLINSKSAMTATANAADKVLLLTRAV